MATVTISKTTYDILDSILEDDYQTFIIRNAHTTKTLVKRVSTGTYTLTTLYGRSRIPQPVTPMFG